MRRGTTGFSAPPTPRNGNPSERQPRTLTTLIYRPLGPLNQTVRCTSVGRLGLTDACSRASASSAPLASAVSAFVVAVARLPFDSVFTMVIVLVTVPQFREEPFKPRRRTIRRPPADAGGRRGTQTGSAAGSNSSHNEPFFEGNGLGQLITARPRSSPFSKGPWRDEPWMAEEGTASISVPARSAGLSYLRLPVFKPAL